MLTVLFLILILSILVLVHEFGHFFVAKKVNVRVEEFGWGLPPRAWGKKIGETIYSINWLPFGGFVKLTGEDFGDEESEEYQKGDKSTNKKDPRNFKNKSTLERGLILIAGVFMNVVLAVSLYYLMLFITGYKTMTLPLFYDHQFKYGEREVVHTVIGAFADGSAAEEAGAEIGEAVIEVNGVPVYSAADVRRVLSETQDSNVNVLLMDVRDVERKFRTVQITPRVSEDGDYLIGVLLTDAFRLTYYNSKGTSGLMHTWNMFTYSSSTLWNLIVTSVQEKDVTYVSDSVSGPVGITRAVSGILSYDGNKTVAFIDLTALLSISLAFLNILPLPALDGGRVLFVVIEAVRGKKISDKIEGNIHRWGMLALLGLLGIITVKDIISLF